MLRDFLRKAFGKGRKSDFFADFQDVSFAEGKLRRATAFVLCLVVIGLTGFALVLNLLEGDSRLLVPLALEILLAGSGLVWLWLKKDAEFGPLYLCLGALAMLGAFLLLVHSSPEGGSLFWFLLFPPMLMFCLGLGRGTVAFWAFMLFILLLLATPLQTFLAEPLSKSVRIRFLVAMLGSFVFSWGTEYLRFHTQKALTRTLARLAQDSLTDPLTGLGNRRDFYNFYNINFLGASASKYPFALAIADLDYFKEVNDSYGHEEGDRALCHVANLLRTHCRETDKIYRWGGEEFLLLMPHTTAQEARHVLDRIREQLAVTPFYTGKGAQVTLTASFGLHQGHAEKDLEPQINAADQNLYAAKNSGRNRVVCPQDGNLPVYYEMGL